MDSLNASKPHISKSFFGDIEFTSLTGHVWYVRYNGYTVAYYGFKTACLHASDLHMLSNN